MKQWMWSISVALILGTVMLSGACSGQTDTGNSNQQDTVADTLIQGVSLDTAGGVIATVIVAALDASDTSKDQADLVCDGIDDDVEINAALSEAPCKVVLTEGTYSIDNSIAIHDDSVLQGSGWGSKLYAEDGDGGPIIVNADTTMGNTNIIVRDLWIDGNESGVWNLTPGVKFRKVTNALIENLWVQNTNAVTEPARGPGIGVLESSSITIQGCYSTDNFSGMTATRNCYGINFINNYIWACDWEGIVVRNEDPLGQSSSGQDCSDILIQGNTIWDLPVQQAIFVEDQDNNAGNRHQRVIITDNNIWDCKGGVAIQSQPDGGSVEGHHIVANNIFHNIVWPAIAIENVSYVAINGNTITSTPSTGIYLDNANQCSIKNNHLTDCGGHGISLWESAENSIANNHLKGIVQVGIKVFHSPNTQCDGNYVVHGVDSGIHILGKSEECSITNNYVYGNVRSGIWLADDADQCIVMANQIVDTTTDDNYYHGITIETDGNFIQGNKIARTDESGHGHHSGIRLKDNSRDNIVSNNDVRNSGVEYNIYDTGSNNIKQFNAGDSIED